MKAEITNNVENILDMDVIGYEPKKTKTSSEELKSDTFEHL